MPLETGRDQSGERERHGHPRRTSCYKKQHQTTYINRHRKRFERCAKNFNRPSLPCTLQPETTRNTATVLRQVYWPSQPGKPSESQRECLQRVLSQNLGSGWLLFWEKSGGRATSRFKAVSGEWILRLGILWVTQWSCFCLWWGKIIEWSCFVSFIMSSR